MPNADDQQLTFKSTTRTRRIVVGTGTVHASRVLSVLRAMGIETRLVIGKWALATLKYESSMTEEQVRRLPCSMKTLGAILSGICDDLISRAADVTLKENRRLVMVVRETPLNDIHVDNMHFVRRAVAVIFPPVPAFLHQASIP